MAAIGFCLTVFSSINSWNKWHVTHTSCLPAQKSKHLKFDGSELNQKSQIFITKQNSWCVIVWNKTLPFVLVVRFAWGKSSQYRQQGSAWKENIGPKSCEESPMLRKDLWDIRQMRQWRFAICVRVGNQKSNFQQWSASFAMTKLYLFSYTTQGLNCTTNGRRDCTSSRESPFGIGPGPVSESGSCRPGAIAAVGAAAAFFCRVDADTGGISARFSIRTSAKEFLARTFVSTVFGHLVPNSSTSQRQMCQLRKMFQCFQSNFPYNKILSSF